MDLNDYLGLKDLLAVLNCPPEPWSCFLDASSHEWASWSELDHKLLDWTWYLQPLEPLQLLRQLWLFTKQEV